MFTMYERWELCGSSIAYVQRNRLIFNKYFYDNFSTEIPLLKHNEGVIITWQYFIYYNLEPRKCWVGGTFRLWSR